jgi:hypothetical protein
MTLIIVHHPILFSLYLLATAVYCIWVNLVWGKRS